MSLVPIADEFALLGWPRRPGYRSRARCLRGRRRALRVRRDADGLRRRDVGRPADTLKPEYETARDRLPAQLAEALARIHSVEPARLDGSPPGDGRRSRRSTRSRSGSASSTRSASRCRRSSWACAGCARWPGPARAWPGSRRLPAGQPHRGRGWPGGRDRLGARHLGDPAEDIGWLCVGSWRFGNDERPVAGVGGARRVPCGLRGSWAAIASTGSGCATGRPSGTSVGGDLRRQADDHLAVCGAATSWPRWAAASASPSGTCSS